MQSINIVITGEVDHGKSTLIGRMIYDTRSFPDDRIKEVMGRAARIEFAHFLDSFKEEREQEMTVDTTQVVIKDHSKVYTLIDSPGHKEFMRNMITGAAYANAAVIVVAIKEGLKEQTRRHAYVLSLMGIKKFIVVVNKMDTIAYQQSPFNELTSAMRIFFKGLNIEPLHFIPASALSGENIISPSLAMPWYGGPSLLRSFESLYPDLAGRNKGLLFSVQDTYAFKNRIVAVGKVEKGLLSANDKLSVLPAGKKVRVSAVKRFLEKDKPAKEGDCVGVVLKEGTKLRRGNVLSDESAHPVITQDISACLLVFAENMDKEGPFLLRCGTQEVKARIREIQERRDSSSLERLDNTARVLDYLDAARVSIHLDSPLVAQHVSVSEALSRFVLLQNNKMCAAGVILGH